MRMTLCGVLCLLTLGCPDEEPAPTDVVTPEELPALPDGAEDIDEVRPPDDAVEEDAGPQPLEPAPFQVGTARARLRFPLGVGTAGSAQFSAGGGDKGPKSRYADKYPATTAIHTHPTVHAVAVVGKPDTVVFVRVDVIGVPQIIRQAVIAEVMDLGGPDLSQSLVIAATHTHAGPARILDNPLWAAITDSFFPELYRRVVTGIAQTALDALNDAEPAKMAFTQIDSDDLHKGRRCETDFAADGRMPIYRFDRADGTTKAIITTYAVHGTVIPADSHTWSRDVHGAIEMKVEERFESPVTALFFNSWSGDMTHHLPDVTGSKGTDPRYDRLEAGGNEGADLIVAALEGVEATDKIVVQHRVARTELSREAMGYDDEEFLFEHGAVYCGLGAEEVCFPEEFNTELLDSCIPFPADEPAWPTTQVGVIRLGDSWLLTMPGEPVTELGVGVVTAVKEATGAENVHLMGYAQDYIGYSLTEEDWYRGGYEAAGSIWGPKQGDYTAQRLLELAKHVIGGESLAFTEPAPPEVKRYDDVPEWSVEPSTEPAGVTLQPAAEVALGDIASVAFHGGDPWLLAPTVTLERMDDGGGFAPYARKNGTSVGTDGYEIDLSLSPEPSYDDAPDKLASRAFVWRANVATVRAAETTTAPMSGGTFRFKITGDIAQDTSYELLSEPFTVGE